jgi:DNA-binding HxlR family transcriptional regulator
MAAGSATAVAGRTRAGGRTLLMLSDALNVSILRLLAHGALPVTALQERLGPTSRTTRFSRLRELEELGVIVREKEGGLPPVTHCSLSLAGRELLVVLRHLRRWLAEHPTEATGEGELLGVAETKALALGWNSTILRWLAEQPCSLTSLDAQSPPEVSYHELRKARQALSDAGLIAHIPSDNRRKPYELTPWMHRAARPLASAIRWEHDFLLDASASSATLELETLLLLLTGRSGGMSETLNGTCFLRFGNSKRLSIQIWEGRAVSFAPACDSLAAGEISGSLEAWLDALTRRETAGLRMRGGLRLTTGLLTGLLDALFPTHETSPDRLHTGQMVQIDGTRF